ncbi:MAG: hydantoinase/oxoprolinase family protein [Syntrophobacteraceae bacterium]|nr:hydantoinase/oxoprolinase family protein [Syntrophobacteraceae bacterium]
MIIGLDVGGTHTDAVLIGNGSVLRQVKVATDTCNLFDCVWACLEMVTRGVPPGAIRRAVLSTTLTTNAIAEGRLEKTGVVVSAGPGIDPANFQIGSHYYCVSGSIDHRGRVVQPLSRQEIETIADIFLAQDIRRVAVVSKFSVRNPQHELEMAEILRRSCDVVVAGHSLSATLNFPRRIATAWLNAAVHSVHKMFFEAVRDSLKGRGFEIPIYVLKADGGTMSFAASLDAPEQTIFSGPAASVLGALPFASREGDSLVLDIGGTTTDIAVFVHRSPLLEPLGGEVGGRKTLVRALKTRSIPLGGDSCVAVIDGDLRIGPRRHGPAMAYGGTTPTPTDALFVLGRAQKGDGEAACRGMTQIADLLEVSIEEAAHLVLDLSCKMIVRAAREMIEEINSKPVYTVKELLSGYRVKPAEILALGGPAPFFAPLIEKLTAIPTCAVPQWHVANAIGAAMARNTSEVTLFADTERGVAMAPGEEFSRQVGKDFDRKTALALACELLRAKCLKAGVSESEIDIDVVEDNQFNMVRDFYTVGRNIRVQVQTRPGLIPECRDFAESMFNCCILPDAV